MSDMSDMFIFRGRVKGLRLYTNQQCFCFAYFFETDKYQGVH